jgi:DNA repair protein RadC
VKGIGHSKAISILAALELGRRKKDSEPLKRVKIKSSRDVFDLLNEYFEDLEHEEFYVVYLNRNNEVIEIKQLSKGGQAGTIVDPKLVYKFGLDCSASSIVLAHNHPSGTKKPSDADIKITRKLVRFGEFLEMQVIEHLIFANNDYFSFVDNGILNA